MLVASLNRVIKTEQCTVCLSQGALSSSPCRDRHKTEVARIDRTTVDATKAKAWLFHNGDWDPKMTTNRTERSRVTPTAGKKQVPGSRTKAKGATRPAVLREELVVFGRRLLESDGSDNISLRVLAAQLGASPALPGYHFGNKEGLLAAIAVSGYEDLIRTRRKILASERSTAEKARQMLFSYVKFALENPGTYQLMFGTRIISKYKYPNIFEAAASCLLLFSTALQQRAADAGWDPSECPYITHAAWAMEHGIAGLILGRHLPIRTAPVDLNRMANFSIAMFLSAIDAGPVTFRTFFDSLAPAERLPTAPFAARADM
jgi:AcrR family transcriptional regulator